jgi:hypothetical protein
LVVCGVLVIRWFRNTNESINDMLFLRKHAKLVRAVRHWLLSLLCRCLTLWSSPALPDKAATRSAALAL